MTTKKELISICKELGIKGISTKSKDELLEMIESVKNPKTTILKTGKRVKYIYHLADIHIRILERHDEYKQVFDNLYEYLMSSQNLENSVVVICGDIFHTKNGMVSETIILFNYFIEKITSIVDIIIISGNHDTFTHTNRMDTISGIVSIKNFDRLYYLRKSGSYTYNNITFSYLNHLDTHNKESILSINKEQGTDYLIGLYHGMISGCKISEDYSIEKTSLSVKDFTNYDYVLLGDIHKRQIINNKKPYIGYPGSLIQQNHKEELEHGMIVWDLENYSYEFVNISNDIGFVTIPIDTNLDFNIENIPLPKTSKLRLLYEYDTFTDNNISDIEKNIKDKIANNTKILSISKEIKETYNPKEILTDSTVSQEQLSVDIFNELICNYPKEIQDSLIEIHTNNIKEYQESELPKSVSWEITKLEFKNVFIYAGDHHNIIDFNKYSGIVGILGNNAIGKSSILNIILHTIFGTLNRNVLNKNENNYFIKLTILLNNIEYYIERIGKLKAKTLEETILFSYKLDDRIINLAESDKHKTLEKVYSTFGIQQKNGKQSFILTNTLSYSNYISLLDMKSSELGNTLSNLFGLQKYSTFYTKTLKEYRLISNSMKLKEGQISTIENTLSKIDINKINSKILSLESLEDTKTSEIEKIKEEIRDIPSIHQFSEEEIHLIKKTNKQETQNKLDKLLDKVCLHCCKSDDSPVNEESCYYLIDNKIRDLDTEITLLEKTKESAVCKYSKKQYDEAKNKLTSDLNLDGYISDIQRCKSQNEDYILSKDLYLDIIDLLEYIKNEMGNLATFSFIVSEYDKYNSILEHNKKVKTKISEKQDILHILDKKRDNILKDIEAYQNYTMILDKIDSYNNNIQNITKRVELVKKENILSKEIKEIISEISKLEHKLDIYEENSIEFEELKSEYTQLEKDERLHKIYKDITNEKCLPKLILKNIIKKIEKEASILSYKLANITIVMTDDTNQEESSKWNILFRKQDITLSPEQISGYERFIVNIALKMALDKNKFYSGSKIFFIDEVFDSISEENFDKVDILFEYLKSYYKHVMIVSHDARLKDKIDHSISISTDYTSSKIM